MGLRKAKQHIHIYKKVKKPDGTSYWKCDHPDCTHYQVNRDLVRGKRSICTVCRREPLIMTTKQLELVNPRCLNCSETQEAKQKRKFRSVVQGVMVDIGLDERNGL